MSLVLLEKSTCSLCSQHLVEGQELVGFPAFIVKQKQYLKYSDAAFHKECFAKDPNADQILDLYNEWRRIWDSRPLDLTTDQQRIDWMDNAYKDYSG